MVEKSLSVDSLDGIPHLNERHASAGNELDLRPKKLMYQQRKAESAERALPRENGETNTSWVPADGTGTRGCAWLSYNPEDEL